LSFPRQSTLRRAGRRAKDKDPGAMTSGLERFAVSEC
jgi:hypothetical protein